jgi:hypothetical protein
VENKANFWFLNKMGKSERLEEAKRIKKRETLVCVTVKSERRESGSERV